MSDEIITLSKAASMLGVHTGTLRRWDAEGVLTPIIRTPGGHRRYRLQDILDLQEQGAKQAPSLEEDIEALCHRRGISKEHLKDHLDEPLDEPLNAVLPQGNSTMMDFIRAERGEKKDG